MSIKNQETLSLLSLGTTTGGNPTINSLNSQNNTRIRDNYGNISIATAGKGEIITQITPANKSTLAPKTINAGDDTYTAVTYKNNLQ